MPVATNVKRQLVRTMRSEIARAQALYDVFVTNGRTQSTSGQSKSLRQTDRRDAAQFIFFEVAAKFESFACDAFQLEVRARLDVQPQRAEYLMGNIDRGLQGVMGWAIPTKLRERARNLFGRKGYFARLEDLLGSNVYQRLGYAHKVRNRIAHSGGGAASDYRALLGNLNVPAASRQGLSPGRLLIEYPSTAASSDRWFHRFLQAYENCVTTFNRSLRV